MTAAADDGRTEQPSLEQLMAKIEQGPLGPLLRDEAAMERTICDLMARSEDATVREMGTQLRDGTVTWGQLGEVAAYRDALEDGARRASQIDLAELSEQLDQVNDQHQQPPETEPPEDDADDPDQLWQGFGRPLGER
ncbi:hypothetical protein [Haloechinothrix sp. LS1_15]|uniref:hypothetical protein n=1 Tax=Haloechinothrix sp. LS1_15 TaxID=2652248 RepID=UPI0029456065|nr:hypothetical protein [Haloechinothrix sp. LS1_15]MDV6014423.1 hypothetical protein [Haloechinothrix sp. LS1_15]